MNPMQNKTPEERRAIAAKSVATRRANKEAMAAIRENSVSYMHGLADHIARLEKKLEALERMETMNAISAAMTGKVLLTENEIAQSALPWEKASGVYFLLDKTEVVYVGQAVNVYSRIAQHTNKRFDRYAFVPCPVAALDMLESLYIHCLRPKLNGNQRDDAKFAPIKLEELIVIASKKR